MRYTFVSLISQHSASAQHMSKGQILSFIGKKSIPFFCQSSLIQYIDLRVGNKFHLLIFCGYIKQ